MLSRIILLILLLGNTIKIYAIESNDTTVLSKWGIDANFLIGKSIKSSSFKPSINGPSYAGDISIFRQTNGEEDWQKKLHYPRVGAGFFFIFHPNKDTLGNAFAPYIYWTYPLIRNKILDFNMKIGFGAAYSTRIWDPITNKDFHANGSHLNFFIYYRLGLEWKITTRTQLLTAVTYTHYSNGSIKLPNLGMNTPSATIGIIQKIGSTQEKINLKDHSTSKMRYKNAVYFQTNIGMIDITRFVKDKSWYTQSVTSGYSRYINPANKISAGSTLEFNFGWPHSLIYGKSDKEKIIKKASTEWSINLTDEILIGHIGMYMQMGVYLYHSYPMPKPYYFRIGIQYHLFKNGMGKNKRGDLYIPVGIISHNSKAHHPETGLGGFVKF